MVRAQWKQRVIATFNVLAVVLAVRFVLLIAVCGAIALTWLTLQSTDPYRLIALGIYAVGVVVPSVYLACVR